MKGSYPRQCARLGTENLFATSKNGTWNHSIYSFERLHLRQSDATTTKDSGKGTRFTRTSILSAGGRIDILTPKKISFCKEKELAII